MKKRNYQKMAMLGLVAGLCTTAYTYAIVKNSHYRMEKSDAKCGNGNGCGGSVDKNSENLGYHLMTEDELMMNLNYKGRERFKKLSPEGKKLALEVASARCDGTNLCKGLNACKTDTNDCAGKGECKGQGKCAFSDKNLAVKLVSKKMAEKRDQITK